MNRIPLLLIWLLWPILLAGQPQALFETTFYFEDAVGNTDSIVVAMIRPPQRILIRFLEK